MSSATDDKKSKLSDGKGSAGSACSADYFAVLLEKRAEIDRLQMQKQEIEKRLKSAIEKEQAEFDIVLERFWNEKITANLHQITKQLAMDMKSPQISILADKTKSMTVSSSSTCSSCGSKTASMMLTVAATPHPTAGHIYNAFHGWDRLFERLSVVDTFIRSLSVDLAFTVPLCQSCTVIVGRLLPWELDSAVSIEFHHPDCTNKIDDGCICARQRFDLRAVMKYTVEQLVNQ